MADFERREFEIGLEFVRWSFAERNNFSEGSSEPNKYPQVIRVRGRQPHEFLNSNYLFFWKWVSANQIMYHFFVLYIRWLGNHQILDILTLISYGQILFKYFVYSRLINVHDQL